MIRDSYRSAKLSEVSGRYVKRAVGQDFYKWCEQSAEQPQYDVAQGTCEAEDLPEHIRKACDEYEGSHCPVLWPME